ncbi:DUF1700 domain-containing protein [Lachnospiraceae bacterium ZAX-1]
MAKEEFLHELQVALQREIPQAQLNEQLHYYDNYIMEESRKGRSESQVIEDLGNPRLIAKTLIDTANTTKESNQTAYEEDFTKDNGKKRFHADFSKEGGFDIRFGKFRLNAWYAKVLLILALVLIVFLMVQLVAFLLPFVVPILLLVFILSYVLRKR